MARRIINKKQKSLFAYCDYKGKLIPFHRDTGYLFSDNKSMDKCVNHFLSQDGFYLKEDKKQEIKVENPKDKSEVKVKHQHKKESKGIFNKKKEE